MPWHRKRWPPYTMRRSPPCRYGLCTIDQPSTSPGVLEELPHYGIFLCLVVILTTTIIHFSSKVTLIYCVFCREQLLFISQICKTSLSLMLQPSTRENPWTRFLGISGKSNHLESLVQSWGTQTRHQRFHVQNLFMVSFFFDQNCVGRLSLPWLELMF